MDAEQLRWRTCGICGVGTIPRGIEWPFWYKGQCVHPQCLDYVNEGDDATSTGEQLIVSAESLSVRVSSTESDK